MLVMSSIHIVLESAFPMPICGDGKPCDCVRETAIRIGDVCFVLICYIEVRQTSSIFI